MIYRPSARLKLTIRTEEFERTEELEERLPNPFTDVPNPSEGVSDAPQSTINENDDSPVEALGRNQERRQALESRRESLSPEEYQQQLSELNEERSQIQQRNSPGTEEVGTPPESVSGATSDDLTVVGSILPHSVQLEFNGLATADTASVEIDYTDAPIDPRIIRAAHVEILVGVVSAENFEEGIERGTTRDDGSLVSVVGENEEGVLEGATRFVGFVDDWSVEYGEDGDTIKLECRDMSAQLRDIKLNPGESIPLDMPIDEGLSLFLDAVSAATRGINVAYSGEGDAPTPSESAPQVRRPRRGRSNRRARRGNQNMSIWDHITDVVRGLGLVPIIRGFDLVLIEPRTLYSTQGVTRMIYGRNLSKLEFSRRLSGVKVPTIEVRCYNPERGRTLWARHPVREGEQATGVFGEDNPPRPLRANEVPPSGANPTENVRVLVVSGVADSGLLQRIAENSFEQIGRQEIEGTFETEDAWSYDLTPDVADLLSLRAGDSVELLIAAADSQEDEDVGSNTTLSRLQAMDRQRRADYMEALGWSSEVASRFAALQDATGFETVFRVQDSRINWDSESGLRIVTGFINYITVREEGGSS